MILSRAFCNVSNVTTQADLDYVKEKFNVGVRSMRAFEHEIEVHSRYFRENEQAVVEKVNAIVAQLESSAK